MLTSKIVPNIKVGKCPCKYLLINTKHDEIGPKLAKNLQRFQKVCEKCMRKWERVCQSMLMHTLIDTQHEDVGPELAKIAQSRWILCK